MPNSYVVNFETGTCETSGYLLVQPFRLNAQGQLQPVTGSAKLLVQLHWVKPEDGAFPSFSGQLGQRFAVEIKDTNSNRILHIDDVSTATIVGSQSVDIGTALWVLNAVPNSTITFSPQRQYSKLEGGAGYFPWEGTLRGSERGSNKGIDVTYVEGVYNAAQNRLIQEFAALGPANANNSGSFFNLIAGATPNQTLPSVQFSDVQRGTSIDFFGPGEGESQMAGAQGAVFAFNGVFKRGRPTDLMQLIRDLSTPSPVASGTDWRENRLFRDVAQSIEDTASQANDAQASFDTVDSDFEGLILKGLRARGGPAATLL